MRRLALIMCALVVVSLEATGHRVRRGGLLHLHDQRRRTGCPCVGSFCTKNGIGYFEHVGRIRGSQSVTIDFNSSQLNDVLKTLTVLDLGSGRVTGVSYNSEAPLTQRLGSLRLSVGEHATLAQLLDALRGARLEVRASSGVVNGRLLGVEPRTRTRGGETTTTDELTLVGDGGEIRVVEITPAVAVKLVERESTEQVDAFLTLLASSRAQDRRRMTIATAGSGERDLLVGYISEVTDLEDDVPDRDAVEAGAALLQAWAIVDNTIGEDWQNVELSLVAGAPQSFIQQLSQPLYVQRPVVATPKSLLIAPQTHSATLESGAGGSRTSGRLDRCRLARASRSKRSTPRAASSRRLSPAATARARDSGSAAGRLYRLFELAGFQPFRAGDVAVEAGTATEQGAELDVGSLAESVTVTGQTPARRRPLGIEGGVVRGVTGGIVGGLAAAPLSREAIQDRLAELEPVAQGRDLGDLFEQPD